MRGLGYQIRLYRREGRPLNGRGDTLGLVFRGCWARRVRHLSSFRVREEVDLTRLVPDQALSVKPIQLLGAKKGWAPEQERLQLVVLGLLFWYMNCKGFWVVEVDLRGLNWELV